MTTRTTDQPVVNRKVMVTAATERREQRWIALTTLRIHAQQVYTVTVIDGTGRMADPRIMVDPSLEKAANRANKLVQQYGGEVPPPQPGEFVEKPPTRRYRPVAGGPRMPHPKRTRDGRWRARFIHQGQQHDAHFDTEQAAQEYINKVKNGGA